MRHQIDFQNDLAAGFGARFVEKPRASLQSFRCATLQSRWAITRRGILESSSILESARSRLSMIAQTTGHKRPGVTFAFCAIGY
jgi:hypothetical protein